MIRTLTGGLAAITAVSFLLSSLTPAYADTKATDPGVRPLAAEERAGSAAIGGGVRSEDQAGLPPVPADLRTSGSGPVICFIGHVQNYGWMNWDCSDDGNWAYAGTKYQGLQLEAVSMRYYGPGDACVQGRSLGQPWGAEVCVRENGPEVMVGVPTRGIPLEKFFFGSHTHWTCTNAHIRNFGDQITDCVPPGQGREVGSTNGILEQVSSTVVP